MFSFDLNPQKVKQIDILKCKYEQKESVQHLTLNLLTLISFFWSCADKVLNIRYRCQSLWLGCLLLNHLFGFFSFSITSVFNFTHHTISFISPSSCQWLPLLASDWYHPVLTLCSHVTPYKETLWKSLFKQTCQRQSPVTALQGSAQIR